MSKNLNLSETAKLLLGWDNILVISHVSPDGDTLGCACALMRGLSQFGKKVKFYCADEIAGKYDYLFEGIELEDFEPEHIVSVDIADKELMGKGKELFGDRVELAIDHHATHKPFAENLLLDIESAGAVEIIYLLLKEMGAKIDLPIADCIYTGLTTDTGCFKYGNVTPRTHTVAAELISMGAHAADINRVMFDSKSMAQVEAERMILETLEFSCGGRCAMVKVPISVLKKTGAKESDLEGVANIPRQIEGVILGVTLKEKDDGVIKASVRANPPANAAELCSKFGGGGHTGAAGCSFSGKTMSEAAGAFLAACEEHLKGLE